MMLAILLQVGHGHEWEFHLGDTATYQSFCSWKKPYHSTAVSARTLSNNWKQREIFTVRTWVHLATMAGQAVVVARYLQQHTDSQ